MEENSVPCWRPLEKDFEQMLSNRFRYGSEPLAPGRDGAMSRARHWLVIEANSSKNTG